MKSKNVKKLLAATLVATMMMATTLTAAAAGGTNPEGSGTNPEGPGVSVSGNVAPSAASSASTSTPAPAITVTSANASVSVAGTAVRTTIAGAFDVKTLRGAAVVTPLAQVRASLGLKDSQTPYIMVFDTDANKSYLAMNCVNAAAQALGGQVVTAINVNLGARENGKFVTLSNGSAAMVVGLPANADTSKTYSVVCVQPGGVVTVLADQDADAATVTFEVKAGIGTYGIVAR